MNMPNQTPPPAPLAHTIAANVTGSLMLQLQARADEVDALMAQNGALRQKIAEQAAEIEKLKPKD